MYHCWKHSNKVEEYNKKLELGSVIMWIKIKNVGMQFKISFYLPFFQIKHFKNRLVISIGNSHFKYRKCWGPANLRALWLRRMFDTFLSPSNIPLIQIWKASSLKHKLINVASLHSLSSFSYNFVKIRTFKNFHFSS